MAKIKERQEAKGQQGEGRKESRQQSSKSWRSFSRETGGRSFIDDMISTGGTIAESIEVLLGAGARPEIVVAATHGLLLDGARHALSHESVREVFVTDSVPMLNRD